MSSRDKIIAAVKLNQPASRELPDLNALELIRFEDNFSQFCNVLKAIGGNVLEVSSLQEVAEYIAHTFMAGQNCITTLPELTTVSLLDETKDAHSLQDTDLAVIRAQFGVAENGAVWVTEKEYKIRALPFICNHLAVIIDKNNIVNTMHHAYDLIGKTGYSFGVFIAGPSKTADIEQSLVLGAHGPKTMTVFALQN